MKLESRKISALFSILSIAILAAGCASTEQTSRPAERSLNLLQFTNAIEQARFTTLKGDTVRVSDFRGKVIMIDFWETWCKPCTNSFPGLQKLTEEYPDNFAVLAVTPGWEDDADDAKDFAENHDYAFNYLLDTTKLYATIGVRSIPYKIFLDTNGNFIKISLGSQGPRQDYEKAKKIVEKYRK
ncbi:MAG: TlpA family protein disulfide reductase [Balneolaceae bacterium]|nr:TlpA family protein disulfide reductase [Balneolaceae bacterium]